MLVECLALVKYYTYLNVGQTPRKEKKQRVVRHNKENQ